MSLAMRFTVIIHKHPNTDYGITIPAIAGYLSAGCTLEEALQNVVEVSQCHIEGYLLDAVEVEI